MVKEMTPAEKPHPSRLLLTLDMTGTFIFALEGHWPRSRVISIYSACWCYRSRPRLAVELSAIC